LASGSQNLYQTADYLSRHARSFKKKVRKNIDQIALEEYQKKVLQYTQGVHGRLFFKLLQKGLQPKDKTLLQIASEPEFKQILEQTIEKQKQKDKKK